nr:multidrug ABC transporter permease [Actinomycetales bacterium]
MSGTRGALPLLRATLRHDVGRIVPWIILLTFWSASSIVAYDGVWPDPADRQMLATMLGANPAMSVIFGRVGDLLTSDGFNLWRAGQLGAFFSALMGALIVIRNSRANEDSGQAELVASGAISRGSRLAVALTVATIAAFALGLVTWLVTVAVGGDPEITLTIAGSFTACALVFAGVAAIAAQVAADSQVANTLSVATIGTLYALRGYVDSTGAAEWLLWLTPFGWAQEAMPVSPEFESNALPLLLALAVAILLGALAFWLQSRRDFGLGLFPQRGGPERGRLSATIPWLALRLNRGSLIGWVVGLGLFGTMIGNMAPSMADLIRENPVMTEVLAAGIVDPDAMTFAFLTTFLQLLGIVSAVAGLQMVLRIHSEELEHRVSPLLAGSLRRPSYLASNVLLAFAATAVIMLVAGTAIGAVASPQVDTVNFADVVAQTAVTIPAAWALVAVGVAAVGALPRIRAIAWLAVVATFAITLLGPSFNLSETAMAISPLHHVPMITNSPDWSGLLGVGAVTLVLLAIGFAGFRRRDIL